MCFHQWTSRLLWCVLCTADSTRKQTKQNTMQLCKGDEVQIFYVRFWYKLSLGTKKILYCFYFTIKFSLSLFQCDQFVVSLVEFMMIILRMVTKLFSSCSLSSPPSLYNDVHTIPLLVVSSKHKRTKKLMWHLYVPRKSLSHEIKREASVNIIYCCISLSSFLFSLLSFWVYIFLFLLCFSLQLI